MERNFAALAGICLLVITPLAALAIGCKWRQQQRAKQLNRWVSAYLQSRYGELPAYLGLTFPYNAFWPVVVTFDSPGTRMRHRLQFACRGNQSTWFLLSERYELRL